MSLMWSAEELEAHRALKRPEGRHRKCTAGHDQWIPDGALERCSVGNCNRSLRPRRMANGATP